MKWVTGVVLVVWVGLQLAVGSKVLAAAPELLIVGLQTGTQTSASEETIEIANVSTHAVDLSGAQLQYFAASATNFTKPSRTIALHGSLAAGGQYLLASTGYVVDGSQQSFASTLAAAGGHLRLVNGSTEEDFVAWGTGTQVHGLAAEAPAPGQVLRRRVDATGLYSNTNSNNLDFTTGEPESAPQASTSDVANVRLSELLPNPAAPATDAEGEYIEIYNGGSDDIDLAGLSLRSGTTTPKNFALPGQTLAADSYLALFAPQTKLNLSNGGSHVQLLGADGQVLDETSYPQAPTGQTWAWDGTGWQWSSQPTPGQPNDIQTASVDSLASTTSAAKKKTTAKKATKPKAKKAAKKTSVKGASTTSGAVAAGSETTAQSQPLHTGIVAGVGSLAVLYGAYEYRQDLANTFSKLRRYRKNRS